MSGRVLVVDDERAVREGLRRALRRRALRVREADSAEQALVELDREPVDVVVSDQWMPGLDGLELLRLVRERHPDVARILLTGRPDLRLALGAVNQGEVFRLLTKPCEGALVAQAVCEALEHRRLLACAGALLRASRRQAALLEALGPSVCPLPVPPDVPAQADGPGSTDDLLEQARDVLARFEDLLRRLGG